MSLYRGLFLSVILGVMAGAHAEEALESDTGTVGVTLVVAGQMDQALLDRVTGFTMDNTGVPIHVVKTDDFDDTSFDTVEASVMHMKLPDDLFVVVLVNPVSETITSHGVIHPEKKIAVVNIKALERADQDQEMYGRRLEKQTIRSMAMLFGLGLCPNPHCALWSYQNDEQLDAMGRNLCPPCHRRLHGLAEEEGVVLIQR
ncbi:MAG: hypothetical protein EOM20_11695 [Spartobacteria bacterium]|nr:hypothetical protein [Spartobacteria bacterium]